MGLTSIILGVVCYYESSWNNKYIKNNIYFVLLYSAVCSAAVISLKFFIFYYIKKYDGASAFYLSHYVPRILYTWALTPIVYFITMSVSKTFRKEKRKIKVRKRRKSVPAKRSSAGRRRARLNRLYGHCPYNTPLFFEKWVSLIRPYCPFRYSFGVMPVVFRKTWLK